MLDKTEALFEWATRDQPDDRLWRRVSIAVLEIGERPWRYPSYPLSLPEGQPAELRALDVPYTTITISYEHHHETGIVNLLLVAHRDPE